MASKKKKSNNDDKKKVQKYALTKPTYAVLGVFAAAIIALVAWLIWPHAPEAAEARGVLRDTITMEGTVLTLENLDEMRERLNAPASPDAHYTISMVSNWRFDTWDTRSENARVMNLERNSRDVYFDVYLVETDELVFSSPVIPLGAELNNFALDVPVRRGEHDAIITFSLVDEDQEVVATVSSTVRLIIAG